MQSTNTILLGAGKRAFFVRRGGADWRVEGPMAEVCPINHVIADPVTGHLHAAEALVRLWRLAFGGSRRALDAAR